MIASFWRLAEGLGMRRLLLTVMAISATLAALPAHALSFSFSFADDATWLVPSLE
jgi:hypothetical protein